MRCDWPHSCKEEGTVNLRLLNYCPAHAAEAEKNREEQVEAFQRSTLEKIRAKDRHGDWLKTNKAQNAEFPHKEKRVSQRTIDSIHAHAKESNGMG